MKKVIRKIYLLFYRGHFLDEAGYTIKSRIEGILGLRNDVDRLVELYGLIRIKYKIFYESNKSLKIRMLYHIGDLEERQRIVLDLIRKNNPQINHLKGLKRDYNLR